MHPKSAILEMQGNRKNAVKQLISYIDHLSKIVEDKDRRIVELEDFIASIHDIAKGTRNAQLDSKQNSGDRLGHQRLESISFKEDMRIKFTIHQTHVSSANLSAPENESLIDNVNSLHIGEKQHWQASQPSSSQVKMLATTRMTQF